ncbi:MULTISPECIES: polysaccharide biosynthesis/export family protein [unclassified Schlesneria]|uniref:polysaccharide biosynthesis/export family protein n=1 Tax=Schlesneria TaxID=656899 RepID=UPI002F254C8E
MNFGRHGRSPIVLAMLLSQVVAAGCVTPPQQRLLQLQGASVPRELDKVNLPDYVVEPPDILLIQAMHTLRSPDARLIPGDRLQVRLKNGLPLDLPEDDSISQSQRDAELQIELGFKVLAGNYRVESSGALDFGPVYGKVHVAQMTAAEAEVAITRHLITNVGVKSPELSVELVDLEAPQPVSGEHLVRPDGRVSLGIYGEVYVAGMTLPEVRAAVTQQLAENGIQDPKVAVDVSTYNSKTYYIISDGGGFGEQVARFQYTGNETVLDAIAQINGLAEVSSKKIWIARPSPSDSCAAQILEVEWEDITALGQTATNYQLMPGDRIYIQADHLVALNNKIEKIVAPVERLLGVSILGFNVVRNSKGVYPIKSIGAGGGGGNF